jgi:hypothetical protein
MKKSERTRGSSRKAKKKSKADLSALLLILSVMVNLLGNDIATLRDGLLDGRVLDPRPKHGCHADKAACAEDPARDELVHVGNLEGVEAEDDGLKGERKARKGKRGSGERNYRLR